MPKKLLVYGAHFAEDLDDAAMFGWDIPDRRFDWPVLRDNVMAEVSRLEGLYGQTLSNHDVTLFKNRAVLTGINPFDQFGVELGKQIARELADGAGDESLDPSTRSLIETAGL